MRIVAYQFKIFVNKSVDFLHVRIHLHGWQWAGLATELQASLFEVVLIEVQIAESVNEITGFQPADLSHHHAKQRIRSDVERHAEKEVRAALVELTAQFATTRVDVELEEGMAGWQCHFLDIGRIPCADDMASTRGIVPDRVYDTCNLVDCLSVVGHLPGTPLLSVDGSEIAIFICPLIPDRDFVVFEILNVRVAFEKPEQLVNDGAQVEFLGREAGKGIA